jgi:thiosulfate/3-mercaptopyruvate sulfurtransferase
MRLPVLAVVSLLAPPVSVGQAGPLVTVEWLAQRLADPDVILFHVGSRATYDAGHIPGAQFLNPLVELAVPSGPTGLRLELPPPAQLDSVLAAKGVSTSSRVVLYWSDGLYTPTARAFFTLEYAGLAGRVHVLDGGLEAWRRSGGALTSEVPTPRPAVFRATPRTELLADAEWVRARLHQRGVTVVDARLPDFYRGGETRQERIGHIPGAVNIPFTAVVEESGWFRDTQTLRALLADAGAADGDTIATYCHIGQQASLVWLAARVAGYPARLYDGSFQDWSMRRELPVVAPAASLRDSLLVDVSWLRANLGRPDLVVIHAGRSRAAYDSTHIPGARFVAWHEYTASRDDLPTELPPVDTLVALVRRLGISNGSRVVVYGDPITAARFFFTLDYLGHGERTALLDGGLEAWRAAGGDVSTEPVVPAAGDFVARGWSGVVVDADWVHRRVNHPGVVVVDARSHDEFTGARPDTTLPRRGHIPGSVNLDWQSLLAGGRFRPPDELRAMLEAAGADPTDEVVATCASGARASVLYFVARYLGYRTRMYDGAFADWSRRLDLPVASEPAGDRPALPSGAAAPTRSSPPPPTSPPVH